MNLNCEVFDFENCRDGIIYFEKNGTSFNVPKTMIKNGKIIFDENSSQINTTNLEKIYTY